MKGLVATAEVDVAATPDQVWAVLTDPDAIKEFMFGSVVETDWRPGSRIVWRGEYQGRPYEDYGTIQEIDPPRRLATTHFSPLSGQEDIPDNHHTIVYELQATAGGTHVLLSQDNNGSPEEVEHSSANWQVMLDGLQAFVAGLDA